MGVVYESWCNLLFTELLLFTKKFLDVYKEHLEKLLKSICVMWLCELNGS